MSKFGFGSTPAASASTGFGFGAPRTTAPVFGAPTATPAPSFGAPGSTGMPSFGAPTMSTASSGFGSNPAGGSLSFGAPNTGVSFGTAPAANISLGFGSPTTTGFGVPSSTVPAYGSNTSTLGFGTATSTVPTFGASNTLSFGGQTAVQSFGTTPATGGLSFGTTPATGGLSFGTTPATGGLSFGTTPTASTGFGSTPSASGLFDNIDHLPNKSHVPALNHEHVRKCRCGHKRCVCNRKSGYSTEPQTPIRPNTDNLVLMYPSPGLGNFKEIVPGTKTTGLGGFGTSSLLSGSTTTTTATVTLKPVSQGLGGIDTFSAKLHGGGSSFNIEPPAKENQLPNEIASTVETFKQCVREQRLLSADIARGSIEPVQKVSEEINSLRSMLTVMCSELQKNVLDSNQLKRDMATTLAHAEMAQRTHEVPPGLQYENTAPLGYFMDLVQSYEKELLRFREKIELTDKHLQSLVQPKFVGEQDLQQGMKQIHDTLVTVAGRLQGVHHEVQAQRQMYMQLRRVVLDDNTDVFASIEAAHSLAPSISPSTTSPDRGRVTVGPTPFSPMGLLSLTQSIKPTQARTTQVLSNTTLGSTWGAPPSFSTTGSPYTSLTTGGEFTLQRPPMSNKRGKH